jgi:PAS domain S-box-containing protein
LEFDRALVFELTGEGKYFSLSYEWCEESVQSFRRSMSGLTIDDFGWPLTELREGRALAFGPRDIPAHAVAAQRVLGRDGTQLMAFVPLVVAGEVIGCIGLHRTKSARRLSERQLERLRLVGEIVADAMARRSAEASLRQSEARFSQVVASALDGFVLTNDAGVVLEWTPQMERILGIPRGEMIGAPFMDRFVFENGRARTWESPRDMREHAQKTPGRRIELLGRHRDGQEVPLELSMSMLDGSRSPVYAVFIRDITDRKRSEQVRQQAFDEIARLKTQIEGERDYLREEIRKEHQLGEFIGRSDELKGVLTLVESVASTSATVLIRGESGVGKELVARAIHARSGRSEGPLVKVNCASIPKELFESEFFGHVRGSFTGAHKDRAGRFELADRGTLFLDEVGEIPLVLQAKLLRVLQESEFERVGDDRTRRVDVRVVAATNRDLEAEAAAGTFRKDLYYRLSVFPIEVPPLRDRQEDIIPLAEQFLRIQSTKLGRSGLVLSDAQARLLESYSWPGNVRELQHVIERAVILSPAPPLRLEAALPGGGSSQESSASHRVFTETELRKLERDNIVAALERCDWRVAGSGGAADLLGLSASTLRDRMRSFDVRKPG